MSLMRVFVHFLSEAFGRAWFGRGPVLWRLPHGQATQVVFGQRHHLAEGQRRLGIKRHVLGGILAAMKRHHVITCQSVHRFRQAQNATSQRMTRVKQVIEIVKNQFGGAVFVGVDFIQNDGALRFKRSFGKRGIEKQIAHQLQGTSVVLFQEQAVHKGLLLGGVGVQLTTHPFHPVQNLMGLTLGRPLEQHVLGKMGHAGFLTILTGACLDHQAATRQRPMTGLVNKAQAVGQGMNGRSKAVG